MAAETRLLSRDGRVGNGLQYVASPRAGRRPVGCHAGDRRPRRSGAFGLGCDQDPATEPWGSERRKRRRHVDSTNSQFVLTVTGISVASDPPFPPRQQRLLQDRRGHRSTVPRHHHGLLHHTPGQPHISRHVQRWNLGGVLRPLHGRERHQHGARHDLHIARNHATPATTASWRHHAPRRPRAGEPHRRGNRSQRPRPSPTPA